MRGKKTHIVKRSGLEEHFDERKVYASCFAACMSSGLRKKYSEKICEEVTRDLKKWMKSKNEVTSSQIFREVIKFLKKRDRDAAFMYETHRDIG